MNLDAVAIVLDLMQPPAPPGALDFNVASWGLMNPGIGIRFDNTSTHKNALLGQAGIFAQFSRILEQSADVVLPDPNQCCALADASFGIILQIIGTAGTPRRRILASGGCPNAPGRNLPNRLAAAA